MKACRDAGGAAYAIRQFAIDRCPGYGETIARKIGMQHGMSAWQILGCQGAK